MNFFKLLLIFTLSIASHANAFVIWQGLEYGASLGEVKLKFNEAFEPKDKDKTYEADELLRIKNYEAFGDVFDVGFFFKDKKLNTVFLTKKNLSASAAISLKNKVKKIIDNNYNLKATTTINNKIMKSEQWVVDDVDTSLTLVTFESGGANLNITYNKKNPNSTKVVSTKKNASSDIESCDSIATYAENVMSAKQNDVALKEMLASNEKVENKSLKVFLKTVLLEAYSSPKYSSKEYKEKAVFEFKEKYYLDCIKVYATK